MIAYLATKNGAGAILTCLSSDTKPTATSGVLAIELDTGAVFKYSGGSWSQVTSSAAWGAITGTLSNQTDLQAALDVKATKAQSIRANANTSNVVCTAADTYLTGSNLAITGNIKAGTTIEWVFVMTKTAAGTATPIYNVRVGTAATTSDTSRLTFTGPAQTAATDTGIHRIRVLVQSVTLTGTIHGACTMEHHNTTTGLQNVAQIRVFQSTSAAFDLTAANLQIGVSCNPGTAGVWTFQQVTARMGNLAS